MDRALRTLAAAQVALARYFAPWTSDGPPGFSHQHGVCFKGSILLRNDSCIMVSPKMYREQIAPHDQRVLAQLGGGGIHLCGRIGHLVDELLALPAIRSLDFGQSELNDVDAIYRRAADRQIALVRVAVSREELQSGAEAERFPTGAVLVCRSQRLLNPREKRRARDQNETTRSRPGPLRWTILAGSLTLAKEPAAPPLGVAAAAARRTGAWRPAGRRPQRRALIVGGGTNFPGRSGKPRRSGAIGHGPSCEIKTEPASGSAISRSRGQSLTLPARARRRAWSAPAETTAGQRSPNVFSSAGTAGPASFSRCPSRPFRPPWLTRRPPPSARPSIWPAGRQAPNSPRRPPTSSGSTCPPTMARPTRSNGNVCRPGRGRLGRITWPWHNTTASTSAFT